MSHRHRVLAIVTTGIVLCLAVTSADAQPPGQRTMGKYGWRWHSPVQFDNHVTFDLPVSVSNWGYGPYGVYGPYDLYGPYNLYGPYEGFTAYGNPYAVQSAYGLPAYSGMDSIWPQRQAVVVPSPSTEQSELAHARAVTLRRQQRTAIEIRNAERAEERRARNRARPEKRPTDLYPRLTLNEFDFANGTVTWPESLLRPEFDADRNRIGMALSNIAQHGADEQTAKAIRTTANRMKKATNSLVSEIGFETYTDTRRFLSSLSVEGYYALEQQ